MQSNIRVRLRTNFFMQFLRSGRVSVERRILIDIRETMLPKYDRALAIQLLVQRPFAAAPDPFVSEAVQLMDTIPGVGKTVAQIIAAEIGVEMSQFPSDKNLSSWAGMCPGNHESAGKRKSGKTTKASRYLRAALIEAGILDRRARSS